MKPVEQHYNGDFEDSDIEESDEDYDDGNDDDTRNRKQRRFRKRFYPNNKIIMNVSGIKFFSELVSDTQYPVIKFIGKMVMKWILQYETEVNSWDLMWTDNAVQPEQLSRMQPHQKINHFPGMYQLARKNYLGRNLTKMQRQFPEEFKFFPRTWLLPAEYGDFKAQFQKGKARTFIVKPEAGCQGRGIFLTRSLEDLNPSDHYVIQRYLHKPFLIEGLKFDLRLYVLLAGCDPLRIYMYKEGLVRFATEEYVSPNSSNMENMCIHLTNYAINKDNPNFIFNDNAEQMDVGHKRSFTSLLELLKNMGHDIDMMLSSIKDIIIKTFTSVQPILLQNYRCCQSENFMNNMCFEVLGFDIMLDSQLRPYLLEVNHTPSFKTDTPLDIHIKRSLLEDTIRIMNINVQNKNDILSERKESMQKRVLTGKKVKWSAEEKSAMRLKAIAIRDEYENSHLGDYFKIYPINTEQETVYDPFLQHSHKLYEDWTGANIRRNNKKLIDGSIEPTDKRGNKIQNNDLVKVYGPIPKNPLYKNVQSKVKTNLLKQAQLQTRTTDEQEDEFDIAVVAEDTNNEQVVTPFDNIVKFAQGQQQLGSFRYPPNRTFKVRHSQQNSSSKINIPLLQREETKEQYKFSLETSPILDNPDLLKQKLKTFSIKKQQIPLKLQQPIHEFPDENINAQFSGSYSNPITKTKQNTEFLSPFQDFNSGKFLKPKVFNLNFIPTHLNDKVHRELVKFKIQNVQMLSAMQLSNQSKNKNDNTNRG